MSSGPATVVLPCPNALQSPRKLLDAPDRIVVETRDPAMARHALTTMAVALFVCEYGQDGADLAGAGLAANPGMRILFFGGRSSEPVARQALADTGAEGGFFPKPFNALAVRKLVTQKLDAALAAGAGAARPAGAAGGAPALDPAVAAEIGAEGPDPERFEILGVAGKGGTGTVYRARSKFLGVEIALKIIDRKLLADPDVMAAFKDEARITMQLSHPNILRLYSFQTYRGCPYIVMELVRGTALRDAILGNGALSTLTACQILAQCASALGYAHQNNVVHKDIKPENIFIDEAGALKIIDFGAAVLNDARAQTSGDIVGTPEYMCPEQLRGDPVGPGADIYALGVMTYLMLVGCFPFPPDTTVDRLLAGLRPDFSALSPELAAVLDRATAYDPAFRYASVSEFAHDVIRACNCESVMFNPFAPIEIIPAQLPDAPPAPAFDAPPPVPDAEPAPEPSPPAGSGTVIVPFRAMDPESEASPAPVVEESPIAPVAPSYAEEPFDDPTSPNYGNPPDDPTAPAYGDVPDDPTAPDYGDYPDDPTAPDYGEPREG
jgi:serine/threonine-protein kinase